MSGGSAVSQAAGVNFPSAPAGPADARLGPGWWVPALAPREPAAKPVWADVAERAVAAAVPPDVLPVTDSWRQAFVVPLRPFLDGASDHLIGAAQRYLSPAEADLGLAAQTFTAVLGRHLARIAVRTLMAELDTARASGALAGADSSQRFADFLRRQCTPMGLVALFTRYPVLARLLGTASWQAAEAGTELLARFAADRADVVGYLLGGADPGPIVAIEPGLGDPHRQSRSVTLVSFADGRKVIYKPRDMAAHLLFCEVVEWLNQRVPYCDLRTIRTVARPGYGWLEFIDHRPLTGPGAGVRFYRREGVLLAALYAMHAADMHCENLLASGEQPVLVDVETLFHPALLTPGGSSDDPASRALEASVHRTALLPCVVAGENGVADQSGMGGGPGENCPDGVLDWDAPGTDHARLTRRAGPATTTRNRPLLGGEAIEPADYEAAVLDGFRLGYDAIVRDRQAFGRLIESGGDIEVRVVLRPSSGYSRLLDESTRPDLLHDARDRDQALDMLSEGSAHHPLWSQLARHELIDLRAGDIPLMTGRPAARHIWTSAGQRLTGLLERPGLSCALDKVAAMDEVDRREQEWIIAASLATRRPPHGHGMTQPEQAPVTATAAGPGRLLTAACGLADQIVARGMTGRGGSDQSRVNWLGLQLVEDTQWMLLPMGAGLADGYLGVALFLAQLAGLTGIGRYAEVAWRAVRPVPQLLDVLADRSDLLAAVGCGMSEGLGGISYGLARMATLLGSIELADWAATAVDLTTAAVNLTVATADLPAPPGWTQGSAGCLAAMIAVQSELRSAAAGSLARACADQLAELVERTGGRCVPEAEPVPFGFATGPAGIGWALTQFAAATAEPGYAVEGHRAMRRGIQWRGNELHDDDQPASGEGGSHGWCSGTAGLLVAHACLADDLAGAGVGPAVQFLTGRPLLCDLSLCHGELGIAEALTVLATVGKGAVAASAWRHRAALALAAISEYSLVCGTPGGVSTPGLLSGLAGIGYGLLRLGFTRQVPSVLFLEATPTGSGTGTAGAAGVTSAAGQPAWTPR